VSSDSAEDWSFVARAARLSDHVRDREGVEVFAHVLAYVFPDAEQDALTFVLARPVLMRTTEVSGSDGSVNSGDDLAESDLVGGSGEHVTASYTPLGTDEACTFEGEEDLLEIRLRKARSISNVSDRGRSCLLCVQRQRQKRTAGVIAASRDLHGQMLSAQLVPRGGSESRPRPRPR
jgi:hypothetical protein